MQSSDKTPAETLFEQLPDEWDALFATWGEPKYRAKQVWQWIQERGVATPSRMSNLPKSLRDRLATEGLDAPGAIAEKLEADDGTTKLLVRLRDGKDTETVLIPHNRAESPLDESDDDDDFGVQEEKFTQCISSQVGCAMGCGFCASGLAGLKRNMTAAEIVYQVMLAKDILGKKPNNLVFMGMGEPLHNYQALSRALTLLTHPEGLNFSRRRITVSTSGLIPEIKKLGEDFSGRIRLAVSLHATTDAKRTALMPINKKYPLGELMKALRAYPMPPRDRMTIEYTLVKGKNDSADDARALAKLLDGLRVKVNLIPMNPVPGVALEAPTWDVVDKFQDVLREHHLSVFVRKRKGDEIAAACGQLALHGERARRKGFALPQIA